MRMYKKNGMKNNGKNNAGVILKSGGKIKMVAMEYIYGPIIGQVSLAFHAHMTHVTVVMEN